MDGMTAGGLELGEVKVQVAEEKGFIVWVSLER